MTSHPRCNLCRYFSCSCLPYFLLLDLRSHPSCQGTILIAVNPLQPVPNPEMSEYMDKALNPEAPHPYAIAEVRRHQPMHFYTARTVHADAYGRIAGDQRVEASACKNGER